MDLASICVVMELFQPMHGSQHLLVNQGVILFSARKGAACERHWSAFLCLNTAQPVVACVVHFYEFFLRVVEGKYGAFGDLFFPPVWNACSCETDHVHGTSFLSIL